MVKLNQIISTRNAGDVILPSNSYRTAQAAIAAIKLDEMRGKLRKAQEARAKNDKKRKAEGIFEQPKDATKSIQENLGDSFSKRAEDYEDKYIAFLQLSYLQRSLFRTEHQDLYAEIARLRVQVLGLLGRASKLEEEKEKTYQNRINSFTL